MSKVCHMQGMKRDKVAVSGRRMLRIILAGSTGGIVELPGSGHLVCGIIRFSHVVLIHPPQPAMSLAGEMKVVRSASAYLAVAAVSCTSLRSTNACSWGDRVCKPLARSNAWRAWAGWLSACKAMPRPIHQTLLSGAVCRAS